MSKQTTKTIITRTVLVLGLLVAAFFGYKKINFAMHHETTDNAQVEARFVPILPRVAGYIKALHVEDYAEVKKDSLLAEIDDSELALQLEEMEAENNRIKAIGIYSKAIVTKYTAMGVNVNGNNPLVTLEIQVLPDDEPAFGATVKGVIKQTSVQLFKPGEEIFVKYDPYDKTKVSIEHS